MCPTCRKKLKFNRDRIRWECPKLRLGGEKKVGCGFISDRNVQTTLNFDTLYKER